MRRLWEIPRNQTVLIVCVCVFMVQLQAAQSFDGSLVVVATAEFATEWDTSEMDVPSKKLNELAFQAAENVETESKGATDPGSKPPHCTSRCGKCTPCTPVRVPVQPGTRKTSEYYPEAWRCKCGGKLYMP